MIIIDFETRSMADLTKVGTVKYGQDLSTEILCVALYDLDTHESVVIDPEEKELPQKWREKLESDELVVAHNAAFDREIYKIAVEVYDYPELAFERWYCSAAQMRVNAMPASLDDACVSTKVTAKKDHKGSALIRKMSIPPYEMSAELMKQMMGYCLKDVKATAAIVGITRLMTVREHKDWLINERINLKGVKVDVELATLAQGYASVEQATIAEAITKLTGGVVTKPTQYERIKNYILDALDLTNENDKTLEKYMTVYKGNDKKYSMDKNVRESVLTAVEAGNLDLFEDIEELIRLLDNASASSVSKFGRMITQAGDDHRVRGAFVYYGASQTGRYASRGLQLHNMKRDCFGYDEAEANIAFMREGIALADPMQRLSKLLRPALIPEEGNLFIVGDWSSIEARGLPWLSADPAAEKKLDLFREDKDVYIEAAKSLGLTEDDRQIGKVTELSLGYGGSVGAFSMMAKMYGVVLQEHVIKRIVDKWRRDNNWAVNFWRNTEAAAKRAIRSKCKKPYFSGRVVYTFIPEMLGGTLLCQLPDGTTIQYPYAKIEHNDRGDSITCMKANIRPKAGETEWGRVRLWGGMMVENICQAFCAGLLRDKLRVIDNVVAHVHDEVIVEYKATVAKKQAEKLKSIMEEVPEYATGLPLKAEPVIMKRYGNH